MKVGVAVLAVLAGGGLVASTVLGAQARPAPATVAGAGPVTPWPRPIPMRVRPEGRDEMMVTTLGLVDTPLADGTFDPVADRVTRKDGTTIDQYFRKHLEVPYYQPVDKSRFPVPPSGWCSWYYYYQEITPEEILANARWIAKNLAPFGARTVQVDDGWQGTGHGQATNRDWTTIDARFRGLGMDGLARGIREQGLEPGIWIAPQGQSNETVGRAAGAFLFKPDGTTAASSWQGTYLLDPTAPRAGDYLRDLFRRLRAWGYSYFKIDGQNVVLREYAKVLPAMAGPVPSGPPDDVAAELYRRTLVPIREAIGPESYLVTSWGIALPAMGLVNGGRSAGDVIQGWEGFVYAAAAVQQWNFLHNVAWYADPDVLEVRPPMEEGIARSWATVFGLSGQALMSSDRLTELPPSRVEMMRRVYPAVDIRPLDLFRPDNPLKPIVDLKVEHLGRAYDVVGVFNYDTERATTRLLSWRDLGLDPDALYHVHDFWGGTYLGSWEKGVFVDVPAADVRVVTLVRATDRPTLVSTSRHITQGWVDLVDLRPGGSTTHPTLAGRSRVVGGDPYRLTVGLPRARPTFRLAAVRAHGSDRRAPVRASWWSHQGYATVLLESEAAQEVSWEADFEPAEPYRYPVESPKPVQVAATGVGSAAVRWQAEYHVKAAYRVEVDGQVLGVAFAPHAVLRDLEPGRARKIGVRSLWYDGSAGKEAAETAYTPTVPDTLSLSDLEPLAARHDWRNAWRNPGRDRSIDGNPLRVGGRAYAKGIGTHASSELCYEIGAAFARFVAEIGIDDEVHPARPVEAAFEVWGDGRLLWKSGAVKSGAPAGVVDVDVRGVHEITLKALPGGDGFDSDHADWLDPRAVR